MNLRWKWEKIICESGMGSCIKYLLEHSTYEIQTEKSLGSALQVHMVGGFGIIKCSQKLAHMVELEIRRYFSWNKYA